MYKTLQEVGHFHVLICGSFYPGDIFLALLVRLHLKLEDFTKLSPGA